jgi:hypothetical protein
MCLSGHGQVSVRVRSFVGQNRDTSTKLSNSSNVEGFTFQATCAKIESKRNKKNKRM